MNRSTALRSLIPATMLCLISIAGDAAASEDNVITLSGEGYEINITYPPVAEDIPGIGDSLCAYSDELIGPFMEMLEFSNPDLPDHSMQISYTWEPSPEGLVCIMAWIWEYSGGAHGNYWNVSMVYDLDSEIFIDPIGLLGDSTVFAAFSGAVREELLALGGMDTSWVETGTYPSPENYRALLPIPDSIGGIAGFHVIFPPYYIGPYSGGSEEVRIAVDQYQE